LLRFVICLASSKAGLQEFRLPIESGTGLRQQGLCRTESSLGRVKVGLLHLRIKPRQDLVCGDVVADLHEALLDLATDSKGYDGRESRLQ
jgi:hypothetical protein